ncbi:hypothetical protein TWF696_001618 [Orbilia brochopaga]|uniref:Uncharacterized protein n=1 Tax=Orbilia brochopaga TaxID=3140254 RepID=A0AAV9UAW5_9PEZI
MSITVSQKLSPTLACNDQAGIRVLEVQRPSFFFPSLPINFGALRDIESTGIRTWTGPAGLRPRCWLAVAKRALDQDHVSSCMGELLPAAHPNLIRSFGTHSDQISALLDDSESVDNRQGQGHNPLCRTVIRPFIRKIPGRRVEQGKKAARTRDGKQQNSPNRWDNLIHI